MRCHYCGKGYSIPSIHILPPQGKVWVCSNCRERLMLATARTDATAPVVASVWKIYFPSVNSSGTDGT